MFRLMDRRGGASKPKATVTEPRQPVPFPHRWWGKIALLLLTIALFDLSFAPFKQFYLAWVALLPWLIMLRYCRSARTAFLWSWLGGIGFFSLNIWWLVFITGPGMAALMATLGAYWAVAGAVIRGLRLLEPRNSRHAVASVFSTAAIWVALEWFRATWPLGGLAWSFIGHSQSPVLALCQIADVTGVWGVSFWLMLLNASVAIFVLNHRNPKLLAPAAVAVIALTAIVVGYGFYRLGQQPQVPGPRVLLVQPNYPQSNSGEKGATFSEILDFHLRTTKAALTADPNIHLVVWSETMMPPLNQSARAMFGEALPQQAFRQIEQLARQYHVDVLAGGEFEDQWKIKGDQYIATDRRNTAYFATPNGVSDLRYDKIHLVPFGEYLPFKTGFPPLYHLFLSFAPTGYADAYILNAGAPDAMTVFELRSNWRFVTPICFEDLDADLLRRMLAPHDGRKRADFIVNITNDGWFRFNEMPQHLQAAVFRSIENHVPTARSVNTGISGFIDSSGRTHDLIGPGREGTRTATLTLDSRITLYSRIGDVFGYLCAAITAALIIIGITRWAATRKRREARAQ
jgi:apolipoprotein N-acyltransferase